MKKSLFLILSLAVFYTSCSDKKNGSETKTAKGNKVYGGVLRLNETENYQTLYPIASTEVISGHIINQIYEGLVKFNSKDLSIIPCIAEKWEMDETGTMYTFHLKKNVFFHDNACFPDGKGRELKASDVAYSFKLLCTDNNVSNNFAFSFSFEDRVVGANKFFAESKNKPDADIEGIKIIDDYTVKISLVNPSSSFLYIIASIPASIVAKEAVEKYGKNMKVGTGPFVFSSESADKLVLVRNNNYHGVDSLGNQLPFLDSVEFTFLPTKKLELDSFKNGNLSMVAGLPSESVKEMIENQIADFQSKSPKYILERSPEMSTQYYGLNLSREPFNNVKVRQAFSYAIDRNKIIDEILKGEAYGPGINGMSPSAFKGYDVTKIKGYNFDPAKAKKLLAEAGYPNGKGFPKTKIELNSGGSKHVNVVLEIQKQLIEVLNVNVDFEVVPMKQKLDDEKHSRADITRSSWVADFPSPENFLWLFYGATVPTSLDAPSYPNYTRYKNAEYDKLFEAGKTSKTQAESYSNFMSAEQLMMNDAPVIVLWYEENYRLIKSNVHDFYSNPMRFKDYSQVYLKNLEGSTASENEKKNAEDKK